VKQLVYLVFYLLLFKGSQAQTGLQQESPVFYFNSFQEFVYKNLNEDSAFFYAKKLASDDKSAFMVRNLIHSFFAQEFKPHNTEETTDPEKVKIAKDRIAFCKRILTKMALDVPGLLSETAKPVYLWTKVQEANGNSSLLGPLVRAFIDKELTPEKFYVNRTGRYGLLIYYISSKHPELKPATDELFSIIHTNLSRNQIKAADTTSRSDLEKRAWYRYLYASVNFTQAQAVHEPAKKESFLRAAFEFSPDLIDKNNKSAYFYDMYFLFDGERTFENDYLEFLTGTSTDKKEVLKTILQIALSNPEYKRRLKEFYAANFSATKFDDYWMDAINTNAKPAPQILLAQLDKNSFSSKQLKGKWILLDFWGTWCGPCRKEHPDLQKFYKETITRNSQKISLLTVACKDTEQKVIDYISSFKYTFPVAMSDNKIENTYPVQGYPTKILITPQGRYLTVPFGVDWINFVKEYCSL
jgi:thiol-disulfide isomerase/thioredoxin